ncbi:TonB-dependent siderophore receptor [Acinetobacter lactucae]|uniref:TonB-dependent siderophore receptor n=1 Tax=Acinetobacter lactucae TaxID=1785128 RepID=UPI00077E1737|nr:TonB-dependent receptor [Acinetobacter lactucae]
MDNIATKSKPLYAAIALVLSGFTFSSAYAAEKVENSTKVTVYNFNIPKNNLEIALRLFTEQSRIQVIVPSELIRTKQSIGLEGRYTAIQALSHMLQNSGLNIKFVSENTVALSAADSGQKILDAVKIEGSKDTGNTTGAYLEGVNIADLSSLTGANGSHDLTATEGNKSYAQGNVAIGGNRPIAAKKVPQNVTIVGNQELQDKKAISLADALQSAPGIYSFGANNAVADSGFYTRGHYIDNFTKDGVSSTSFSPNSFSSEIALYDHIEILRGGDAFTGSANSASPSASINLVRKKPLPSKQSKVEVSIGSWDHFQQIFDTTGPLNQDTSLRGRFIFINDLNKNFWNNGDTSKQTVDGQLEYDFSEQTRLNVGLSGAYAKSKPWAESIYADDTFEFPRKFSTAFDENKRESKSGGVNFSFDHKINNKWSLNLKGNKDWDNNGSSLIAIDVPWVQGSTAKDRYTNNYFDYSLVSNNLNYASEGLSASMLGYATILGLEQSLEFATSYNRNKSKYNYSYYSSNDMMHISFKDLRNINLTPIITERNKGDGEFFLDDSSGNNYKTYFAYLKLDLQPIKGLHIMTGPRWKKVYVPSAEESVETNPKNNFNIPYSAIRYDINKNFSVYSSYVDLFSYNDHYPTRNSKPLKPVEGNTKEIGIKFSNDLQNLTGTLALYTSRIKNGITNESIKSNPKEPRYFINIPYEINNKGIEFSLEGQVTPYWQTSAGYTYTKKIYKNIPNANAVLLTESPWIFKFSNQFKLTGNPILDKITLGISTSYISARNEQVYEEKIVGDIIERELINYKVKSYSVTDIFAKYQINDTWSTQININNIFDKKYIYASSAPSTGNGDNFYGTPVNYLFTLQGKF